MSWYVITTPRHQERLIRQTLDDFKVGHTFLPMRMESVTDPVTGKPRVVNVPVIPGLVFVQTTREQLGLWLSQASMGARLYMDSTDSPVVVPDYQIRLFKDYLSFVSSEVMVLRKPYSYFLKKKKIRILSGKFAGLEGRLFQVKGNYKLVYGLGNTALALSDIAKNPYVEITDEEPSEIRFSFYHDKMQEELDALMAEDMDDSEILRSLNRWRQEASILTSESPVASSYVSLALQQSLSHLHTLRPTLFGEKSSLRKLKSIYQDTEDYLSITLLQIDDATVLRQVRQRREKIQSRTFYASDPFGLRQDDGTSTTYGFVREQEARLAEIIRLLDEAGDNTPEDESAVRQSLKSRRQAFQMLAQLFLVIARKLEQRGYRETLDSTANYRLRRLLALAAHRYRSCKAGQDEDFVMKTQATLKSLLSHDLYRPHGFFDLLAAIRRS